MADPLDGYDFEDDADDLETLVRPYYVRLLERAYEDANEYFSTEVDFDQSNPQITKTIDGLAKRIRGVAETTREDVRVWIERGTSEGLSLGQIAEQIRSDAADISKSRATMIARTETASAYSGGSVLAYKEAGLEKKQWLASTDSCDLCAEMDNEVVGIDEEFSGGVDNPPLHPLCTCGVAPVVE